VKEKHRLLLKQVFIFLIPQVPSLFIVVLNKV